MKTIPCAAGEVLFREGDFQLSMYEIQKGSIGIYLDYETEQKLRLTVLEAGRLLGEMGLIEASPRAATAVALEETTLLEIPEEEFYTYFQDKPDRLLQLLKQLSGRIRDNTERYFDVCRALSENEEAMRAGREKSEELNQKLAEISETAKKTKRIYSGTKSSFFDYVQADLDAYEGKRNLVQAGVFQRLLIRRLPPEEMHANPDDEFSRPDIGPSDRIINEYMHQIPLLYRDREHIFPSPIMVYKMEPEGYLILNGHHRWAAAIKSGLGKVRATILNPPK